MKRFKITFYAWVFFSVSISSLASAGGFEGPGLGSRATSMGGAFIGVADDWTAIYWNPAGLSQLKGAGFGSSLEWLHAKAHDSSGLANPAPPLGPANTFRGDTFVQFGGEPAQFNGSDSDFNAFLPGIGFYGSVAGFTFAGGSYSPLGFAFEVADAKEPGFDVSFKSQGYIVDHNFSIARSLLPWLHVGAGVNAVQSQLGRFADKKAPGYETSTSAKGNALNVQGICGLLLDWGKRAHLGGVYRTGQDLSIKGHADIEDGRLPTEASDFTQTLRNPTTYGVGLSFLPIPSVTLAVDWQRTAWNASKLDIQFDQPGALLQNQNLNTGWMSTSRYRFGAEWRLSSSWSFRGGYFRDPRAVSFASEALTNIVDVDLHYYTAGFSFSHGRWRWNLGEQYAVGSEHIGNRTLRKEATSMTLGIDYALQ